MKKLIFCILALAAVASAFSSVAYAAEPNTANDGTVAVEAANYLPGEYGIDSSDNNPVTSTLSFSSKKATCITTVSLTNEGGKCKKIKQTLQKYSTSSGWQDTSVKWEKTVALKSEYTLTNTSSTASVSGQYRLKSEVTMKTSSGTETTKIYYSSTVTI